jgi:site-specific recombinase XerD
MSKAIETFLLYRRAEGLTAQTLGWYARLLGKFSAHLGPREVAEVKPTDIVRWINGLQDRGLSSITVEGNYRALLTFFTWCETSPAAGNVPSPIGHGHNKTVKRPKVDEPDMDFVSFEEYISLTTAIDLCTWLDYRDWSMIGVMFWCGVRRGELLQMEVRDLNVVKSELRIRHSKVRKQRTVFLLDDLMAGIHQYLALRPAWAGPQLWLAYDKARRDAGGALGVPGMRMMLERRCKWAGIRMLHPHLFRHGFAMGYLNHGADLKAVATLMGHSSSKTTERHYAKWIDGPLRELHERVAERISSGE